MSALLARALVFGSSAAVLVLEILAGRLMAPYLGVTLETFTGIIGVVLAGIAAGAWAGGRMADRVVPGPLLGPILAASGLLVLAAPPLVDQLGPSMRAGGPLEIVALTATGFFLPAFALSMIPPIVVKLRLSALERTGSVVGDLSALGTAGALLGTFVTGFVLVAAAPTRPLLLGVGVLLVLAGVALVARERTGPGSRRNATLTALAVLPAAALLGLTEGPCDFDTKYYCAVIEVDRARPTGRTLWLDTLPHSYVDLADPTHLEFRYARTVADVVAETRGGGRGPIDAVYIGGGGFTLPRYFAAVRPGSRATVLEIDGVLVEVVRRELGLELSDALRVEVGDARLELREHASGAFDVVVGDAFGGLSVPWHLTTREFLLEINRVLASDGVYVVNVIDFPPLDFARAEVATALEVFPHVAVIAPVRYLHGERGGNFVIVASRSALPVAAIQARLSARAESEVVWAASDARAFAGAARVLTDDFAPVDQLLSRPRAGRD